MASKLDWVRHQGRRVYFPRDPYDSCPNKTRYDTELAARMGAQAAISNPRHCGKRRLWVYPCLRCHGWHMTSDPDQKGPAVTVTQLWQGVDGVPAAAIIPLQHKDAR